MKSRTMEEYVGKKPWLAMKLKDEGTPTEEIAKVLGVSRQYASTLAALGKYRMEIWRSDTEGFRTMSVRAQNICRDFGLYSRAHARELIESGQVRLMLCRNCGKRTAKEILDWSGAISPIPLPVVRLHFFLVKAVTDDGSAEIAVVVYANSETDAARIAERESSWRGVSVSVNMADVTLLPRRDGHAAFVSISKRKKER